MLIFSLVCNTEGCANRIDSEEIEVRPPNRVWYADQIVSELLTQAEKEGWKADPLRKHERFCPECARRLDRLAKNLAAAAKPSHQSANKNSPASGT